MRITGGEFKGRQIIVPQKNVRPTSSLVKEAMFSMLNSLFLNYTVSIEEFNCLDLFSGSGALGFEALSRGAKSVTFVDNSPESISTIKQNIKILHLDDQSKVIRSDVINFLNQNEVVFDLVFCDPPYGYSEFSELLLAKYFRFGVFESNIDNGNLFESSDLAILKSKRYGSTHIVIAENTRF